MVSFEVRSQTAHVEDKLSSSDLFLYLIVFAMATYAAMLNGFILNNPVLLA